MITLIQRVKRASVSVDGTTVGQIEQGLLVLVCAEPTDTDAVVARLLDKLLKLRIFSDAAGKMNLSVQDIQGGLLLVSQFTLAADTSRGNRPSFVNAAPPVHAQALYETLLQKAREQHAPVAQGRFGADMQIELVNDGPVTIPLVVR